MEVESKVRVQIGKSIDRSKDLRWLHEHCREHVGAWVALEQGELVASGADAAEVYAAARRSGVARPLLVQVQPAEALPFGGW